MKKPALILVAAMTLSSAAFAQAVSTTTMRWSDAHGNLIREHTETKQYKSIEDAQFDARVGVELPASVTTT